jgi:hypothetical protein
MAHPSSKVYHPRGAANRTACCRITLFKGIPRPIGRRQESGCRTIGLLQNHLIQGDPTASGSLAGVWPQNHWPAAESPYSKGSHGQLAAGRSLAAEPLARAASGTAWCCTTRLVPFHLLQGTPWAQGPSAGAWLRKPPGAAASCTAWCCVTACCPITFFKRIPFREGGRCKESDCGNIRQPHPR